MDLTKLIQIFVIVVILGIIYNLWQTTKAYGGLIGGALKWIGLGIIFFSLESLDRVLGGYSFVDTFSRANPILVHNAILLFGLLFSAIGFSKLTKIAK